MSSQFCRMLARVESEEVHCLRLLAMLSCKQKESSITEQKMIQAGIEPATLSEQARQADNVKLML